MLRSARPCGSQDEIWSESRAKACYVYSHQHLWVPRSSISPLLKIMEAVTRQRDGSHTPTTVIHIDGGCKVPRCHDNKRASEAAVSDFDALASGSREDLQHRGSWSTPSTPFLSPSSLNRFCRARSHHGSCIPRPNAIGWQSRRS